MLLNRSKDVEMPLSIERLHFRHGPDDVRQATSRPIR